MDRVLLTHAIMFLVFFALMASNPYVLREAHVYGSALIGVAAGGASLASLLSKLLSAKKGLRAKYGLEGASLVLLASSYLPLFGYPGFVLYMIATEVSLALLIVITLVVVAESVEPHKLGFHYAVRGTVMSVAAFFGPIVGGLAYSSYGLFGACSVRALAASALYFVQKPLRGYVVKGSKGGKLSRRWFLAYLTSFFLASALLIVSTYLPPYQASVKSSYLSTTYFFSGRAVGSGSVRMLGGIVADVYPTLIFVPALIMLLGTFVAVYAVKPLISALAGFFVGSAWGLASPSLLSIAAKESEKGKSMSLFVTGWDVASIVMVPLAGSFGSYELSLRFASACALVALFISLVLSLEISRSSGK